MIKVFYHAADLDGHCSGAIVKFMHSQAELIPIDYGDKFPMDSISKGDTVYMVDFSLKMPEMSYLNSQVSEFIWIDHHESAIKAAETFGLSSQIKGHREIGKAGCELTWEYLFGSADMPKFVTLLGRYDVWDHSDKELWDKAIFPFQIGMRCRETDPAQNWGFWESQLNSSRAFQEEIFIPDTIRAGQLIVGYQERMDAKYARSHAYSVTWEGHFCIAMNTAKEYSSKIFDSVFDPSKYDLMIAYSYAKGLWEISLYSDTVDCAYLAARHGGGGHKGAAGFLSKSLPFVEGYRG